MPQAVFFFHYFFFLSVTRKTLELKNNLLCKNDYKHEIPKILDNLPDILLFYIGGIMPQVISPDIGYPAGYLADTLVLPDK